MESPAVSAGLRKGAESPPNLSNHKRKSRKMGPLVHWVIKTPSSNGPRQKAVPIRPGNPFA